MNGNNDKYNDTQGYTGQYQNYRSTQSFQPQKKKKKKLSFNKDGVIALLTLIAIVAVVVIILVLSIKAISGAVKRRHESSSELTGTAAPGGSSSVESTQPQAPKWNDNYTVTSVSTADMNLGPLVLVNYNHVYSFPAANEAKIASLWGYEGYNTSYVLKDSKTSMNRDAFDSLSRLFSDMVKANPLTLGTEVLIDGELRKDKLMVVSGYRTAAYQEDIYNRAVKDYGTEQGALYAALPGYSEHHTGYAFDIKVYTAKKATVDLRTTEQTWLTENCAKYGFVQRYEGSKFELTKIMHESWHFRYVGLPHSYIMTENNMCLEEYIAYLKNFTYDSLPLEYSADGKDYLIYYVPADKASATTFVPVPSDKTYTVSGNNEDGFIVTVVK